MSKKRFHTQSQEPPHPKRKFSKQEKKKTKKPRVKDEEETKLEELVFGATIQQEELGNELEQVLDKEDEEVADEEKLDQGEKEEVPLFVIDKAGGSDAGSTILKQKKKKKKKKNKEVELAVAQRAPAWVDEDDDKVVINIAQQNRLRKLRQAKSENKLSGTEYSSRLRTKFKELNQDAGWAQLPESKLNKLQKADDVENDEEREENDENENDENEMSFLQSTESLVKGNEVGKLRPGFLQIVRMKDANIADRSQAVISTVKFHPSGQILFTAGFDKTIRLFQVDGLRNAKIQGVFIPDLPITCGAFSADGREIIVTGKRKYFYSLDLGSGRVNKVPSIKGREEKTLSNFIVSPDNKYMTILGNNGYLIFLDMKTKQWVNNFKLNGSVRAASFTKNGQEIYSLGDDGEVYIWDVRSSRCLYKHVDDGCIHGTALTVSNDEQFYATGSDSGVVNVYQPSSWQSQFKGGGGGFGMGGTPLIKPIKALMQLTTPVDTIKFNVDSQILAIASRRKKDQLRLIHLPSMTAYGNWPTSKSILSYVNCVEFSPHGGYIAFGNDRGYVALYRISHYHTS